MQAHVIGVVRGASRLDALVLERCGVVDPAAPWRFEYACERRPLDAGDAGLELWAAWNALAAVTRWDRATLEHVWTVVRSTVPCSDPPAELPLLVGDDVFEAPAPRATAAHPRAFRGTKHRPPRVARPEAVDVRPYLLARRHVDQVLALLGQPRGIDPYIAWNHGVEGTASFEPWFGMHLLPLFRACTWSDVGAFAVLARTLDLRRDSELRNVLASVYLAAESPARALAWWNHVLAHDPAQRVEAAQLVAASGVARLPVDGVPVGLPAVQQWTWYRGLVGGASLAYLEAGLALGALSTVNVGEPPPGREDVGAIVEATVQRLEAAMQADSGAEFWRTHLWKLCGYQPDLVELLACEAFAALTDGAAFTLVRMASMPRWSPETAEAEWRELGPVLPRIAKIATEAAPAYQQKLVEDMLDVYLCGARFEGGIVERFAKCVDYCMRVARPPFGTEAVIGPVLPYLALASELHGPLATAPDASWLALEAACRRRNQMRLIARGIDRLQLDVASLVLAAFSTHPRALFETADLIAALSWESSAELLAAYSRSPVADPSLASAPIERLCDVIAPIARAGGGNPVRRALREHLSGARRLSEAQIRGHRARIVEELDGVRLAAIRQAVERVLAVRIGAEKLESSTVRHAAAMLGEAETHRRQLRRLLAATVAGDAAWRLRHPRSVEWFARHPRIDRARWLAGIETTGRVDGIGEVRIAVETDPLEALKLGTYVGSCLGRGGMLEYSAAAVVLDVNKHVIYARDRRGAVVGRQLVALSESDELVCFGVYGTVEVGRLEPLFREHDRAFASALGLAIFDGTASETYEIATVLSREWWDDSAWLAR